MEKQQTSITPAFIKRYNRSPKGKLFLFLTEANNIAILNHYDNFKLDPGVKTVSDVVNTRIDTIFKEKVGIFWKQDFRGYDQIREKALKCTQDILERKYTPELIDFVEASITSYLPKIDETKLKGQTSKIPRQRPETHIGRVIKPGMTGEELKEFDKRMLAFEQGLEIEVNERKGLANMLQELDEDNHLQQYKDIWDDYSDDEIAFYDTKLVGKKWDDLSGKQQAEFVEAYNNTEPEVVEIDDEDEEEFVPEVLNNSDLANSLNAL